MLGKYVAGFIAGVIYIFVFCRFLHPIELRVKGRRWHHNPIGTIVAVFLIAPLTFFFYVLNFEYINLDIGINLFVSLLGLASGAIFEHEFVEKFILKNE